MDKIEVGEHVRTDYGEIHKVVNIVEDDGDWNYYTYENDMGDFQLSIVKHSKQLTDLIEVEDIIKYRIDNISTTLETKGYIKGIVDIADEEMLQRIKSDKNYNILEILTKESYMANCYKVGEENIEKNYKN